MFLSPTRLVSHSFPEDHWMSISWQVKQIMHSRQYISNVEGPPKFCIDLEADWLLILGEVGGKSPGLLHIIPIYNL